MLNSLGPLRALPYIPTAGTASSLNLPLICRLWTCNHFVLSLPRCIVYFVKRLSHHSSTRRETLHLFLRIHLLDYIIIYLSLLFCNKVNPNGIGNSRWLRSATSTIDTPLPWQSASTEPSFLSFTHSHYQPPVWGQAKANLAVSRGMKQVLDQSLQTIQWYDQMHSLNENGPLLLLSQLANFFGTRSRGQRNAH